jgi:hypothetical protein
MAALDEQPGDRQGRAGVLTKGHGGEKESGHGDSPRAATAQRH